jgi:hypothetical protein
LNRLAHKPFVLEPPKNLGESSLFGMMKVCLRFKCRQPSIAAGMLRTTYQMMRL